MALNPTQYQFKLVETNNLEGVAFAAGQFIITDDGQTYYDPSTGTTIANRIALSPDLKDFLKNNFTEKIVTDVAFADATEGSVNVTITTVDPSTSSSNTASKSFKTYTISETPTAKDKNPISSAAVKTVYDELIAKINEKQNILTAGDAITIEEDEALKIDVKVDPDEGNILTKSTAGLKVTAPDISADLAKYEVKIAEEDDAQYVKVYHVTQEAKNLDVKINIPKDMVVKSGGVKTFTAEDKPQGVEEAGTYVELVLANATEDKIYINVTDLVEIVDVDNSDGKIHLALNKTGKTTTIKATINPGTITEDDLSADVKAKLAEVAKEVKTVTITGGSTNGTIKLTVNEEETDNIAVTGLNNAAYKAVASIVTDAGENVPTEKAVADYVKSALTVYRSTTE